MECNDKYVQRVTNKYNRRRVIAFVQKRAEQRFLSPLGLTLKRFPQANFGNNCDRLNLSEEFELFTALHYMKYKITRTNMRQCRGRYLQIYLALRNRGISANRLLVLNCVQRHLGGCPRGLDKVQLIERGYLSLIYAVDGFDPWRGYRFSTYACNAITRGFYNRSQMTHSLIPIEEIDDVSSESADEEQGLWLERLAIILKSDNLTFREKEVLKYRFHERLTLHQVGIIWGLTKERVRQIQIEAMSKLKEALNEDPILS